MSGTFKALAIRAGALDLKIQPIEHNLVKLLCADGTEFIYGAERRDATRPMSDSRIMGR